MILDLKITIKHFQYVLNTLKLRRDVFLELQISKRCFMLSQRNSCTVFSYNLEFVNRERGEGGWSITNINRQIIYENFQEKNKDNSIGSFKVIF